MKTFKTQAPALGEEGRDSDEPFSPRVVLTNVPPVNAPVPPPAQVPSPPHASTLFNATSWMFYLPS